MAPDEPESGRAFPIILTILVFAFLICIVAIPIITFLNAKQPQPNNQPTVIHDTIIIRDTIRIEQTPVTFICHGICNGIEDFSRD